MRKNGQMPWIVAMFALGLYLVSVSSIPEPGTSSIAIASYAIQDQPVLSHPWYGLLARLTAAVPTASVTWKLNLLNACLTSAAVGGFLLLFRRLAGWLYPGAGTAGPTWAAGAYLAILPSVWWAGTRAGPDALGMAITIFALASYATWLDRPGGWRTLLAGFATGLCVVEAVPGFPLFVIPFLLVMAAICIRLPSGLGAGLFLVGGIVAVAPLAPQLAAYAELTGGSPLAAWLEGLRAAGRHILDRAAGNLPRFGWVAVLGVTALPLMLLGAIILRRRKRQKNVRKIILLALLAVLLSILFPVPYAPYRFSRDPGVMASAGLCSALAFGLTLVLLFRHSPPHGPRRLRRIVFGTTAATMVAATALAFPHMTSRVHRDLWGMIRETVRRNGDTEYLVVGSPWAALYRIAIFDMERRTVLLQSFLYTPEQIRKLLQETIADPDIRALAGVSPVAAARALVDPAGGYVDVTGVDGHPGLWLMAGLQPAPRLLMYRGYREPDADVLTSDLRELRTRLEPMIGRPITFNPYRLLIAGAHEAFFRKQCARTANDLGVALDHAGAPGEAARAYVLALQLEPDHPAALLNLISMHEDLGFRKEAGAYIDRFRERWLTPCEPDFAFTITSGFGLIRNTRTLHKLQELCAVMPEEPDPFWSTAIGNLLTDNPAEALAHLQTRVQDQPDDDRAWMLLGVLAHRADDTLLFRQCVDRMLTERKQWPPILALLAQRAIEEERPREAEQYLDRAEQRWPLHAVILELQIQLDLHLERTDRLNSHLAKLLSLDPGNAWANYALGVREFTAGRLDAAESALLRSVGRMPLPIAYNNLAWILLNNNQLFDAELYARRAIELDPFGSAQWHTLAEVLDAKGDPQTAAHARERSRMLERNNAGED